MIDEIKNFGSLEDKLSSVSQRNLFIAMISLILVVGVAIVSAGNLDNIQSPDVNNITEPREADNNDTSEQEEPEKVGLSPSDIQGDITDVTVDDERADPAEAVIPPEDGIRFVNEAGLDLEFEFDRNIDTFQVSAGESIIINPESIVYYTVNPVDENVEFREISARINVQ